MGIDKAKVRIKDPYTKYEHTRKSLPAKAEEHSECDRSQASSWADTAVSDNDEFWKDLDDGKLGKARDLMISSEDCVGQVQDLSQWVSKDLCPPADTDFANIYEDLKFECNFPKPIMDNYTIVYPDQLMEEMSCKKKKPETDNKKSGKKKKTRNKETLVEKSEPHRELPLLGMKSDIAKPEHLENSAQLENTEEMLEKSYRGRRDAENLMFFRTMARDSEFWKPGVLNPLPGDTSQRPKSFRVTKVENGVVTIQSKFESLIPKDPGNYVSEAQAEENLMFFKYVARNRSFFQFKENE